MGHVYEEPKDAASSPHPSLGNTLTPANGQRLPTREVRVKQKTPVQVGEGAERAGGARGPWARAGLQPQPRR